MIIIFTNIKEVENFIYESYMKASPNIPSGLPDKDTRNPIFTRKLLDNLGQPDHKQYNILVTGSKGKGSASRLISSILQAHGYKVGLFTSPHLINFKERIRINGIAIKDEDLVKYANHIKPYVENIQQGLSDNTYIGPVGISAVIAMLYYLDNRTRFNVIECGKGARYDDVNMVFSRASVINTVFEEHMPQLGNNILEVAYSKAGVIKPSQDFTFSARQQSGVLDVIDNEANINKVKLLYYDRDFRCSEVKVTSRGTQFNVITKNNNYENLTLRLLGRHQAYNAAMAISVAENILKELDTGIISDCMKNLTWPGRLEIIGTNPTVMLDGCINKECAQYVSEVVQEIERRNTVFIIGIPDDKDYMGVVQSIEQLAGKVILTKTKNPHLKFEDNQYKKVKEVIGDKVSVTHNIDEAMDEARSIVSPEDMICIIGTQSLVKETKELFNQDTLDLE